MKNKKLIIAVAGLVVLLIVSYGLYYFMSRNYENGDSDSNLVENEQTAIDNSMNQEVNQGTPENENETNEDGSSLNNDLIDLGVDTGDSESNLTDTTEEIGVQSLNEEQNGVSGSSTGTAGQSGSTENSNQTNSQSNSQNNTQSSNQSSGSSTQSQNISAKATADFTVYDANGNAVKLSSLFGKPIVINFWASWCSPCKSEMPYFQSAYETYGSQVQFVMVNLTDGSRETVSSAKSYISQQGFTFPVYYDTSQSAATAYSVTSIPKTYFINADGTEAAKTYGTITQSQLTSYIKTILN